MSDITMILQAVSRGENQAAEELLPHVYEELRKLAAARMARESSGQTLQPTALVHEAWLRLMHNREANWRDRSYFFAAAAEAMRRILVENARRKARLKHGGGQERLNIEQVDLPQTEPEEELLRINEALELLEKENPERAQVVVLKYFSGMTNEEVAEALGIGERTVRRHWVCAKDWLFEKIHVKD
jgi:RNA polymerase sigma factor (TIGR02999 family)